MTQDYVRFVSVLDAEGATVMDSDLGRVGTKRNDALSLEAVSAEGPGYRESRSSSGGERLYVIHSPVTASGARLGTVLLGYSLVAVETEIADARLRILAIWLILAGLAGVLAFVLASYFAVPITKISEAMQHASEGEVKGDLQINRSDEIGILAASFNKMADDLSRTAGTWRTWSTADRRADVRQPPAGGEVADRTRAEAELRVSRQELRDLAAHLQSVREQERAAIAREIHDELGQALTALKMDVHWLGQHGRRERRRTDGPGDDVEHDRRHGSDRAPHLLPTPAEAAGRPRSVGGHRVAGPGIRAAIRASSATPVGARRHRRSTPFARRSCSGSSRRRSPTSPATRAHLASTC